MKNIQKIAVLILAVFALTSVKASVLYWQVEPGTAGDSFQYALLKATTGSGDPVTVAGASAQGTAPEQYVSLQNTELGQYGNDSYSFFVEMANYADGQFQTVATGATYTYNELVSSGYVATGATSTAAAQAAASQANMGSAVPEPSSGLLLLMGGAMLALRRRRQK